MKRLGLLRHAKSSWDHPGLEDFERPLNRRGREAATRMGEELRDLDLKFDLALVSPARRAAETFRRVRTSWDPGMAVRDEPRIYAASLEDLLGIIGETGPGLERLLLVGHNPAFHELALLLAPAAGELAGKFPTGALAEIQLATDDWAEIGKASGRLIRFLRPRDLD